jgi:CcmD family protein
MRKLIFLTAFIFLSMLVQAQDAEMADVMRSNGKIYVVIAVMVTILLGVVIYLIRLDRKISKLEKNK